MHIHTRESVELSILADSEQVTIFRHGQNDYSIYFEDQDYSVRGSLLVVLKEFADQNYKDFYERTFCTVTHEYSETELADKYYYSIMTDPDKPFGKWVSEQIKAGTIKAY